MTESPKWIAAALARQPAVDTIEVDGAAIRYRYWGEPGERDIVLVHGGAAHARWWDHIAPLLATNGRVVTFDLSGHGDSDHRPSYSITQWGAEVLAVAAAAGLTDPDIVGHSLGGLITLGLLQSPDSGVTHAIMIDSPIGGQNAEHLPEAAELTSRRPRVYASEAEVISRFRTVPPQSAIPAVFDHVVRHSYRAVEGGFTWKFDGLIFEGGAEIPTHVPEIEGQLAFLRAEQGLVGPEAGEAIEKAGAQFIEIPDAGHAPMLDQPIALIVGIRAIFAGWDQLA